MKILLFLSLILGAACSMENGAKSAVTLIDDSRLREFGLDPLPTLRSLDKIDVASIDAVIAARDDFFLVNRKRLVLYRVATPPSGQWFYYFFSVEGVKDHNVVYAFDLNSKTLRYRFNIKG